MKPSIDDEIARYMSTGKCDPNHAAWPGDLFERARLAHDHLRGALVRAARQAARGRRPRGRAPRRPRCRHVHANEGRADGAGAVSRGRARGRARTLERSAIFVRTENIEEILRTASWDDTAWNIANMYLDSLGAKLLGPDAPRLVGLSEETSFFVSLDYYA